MTRKRRKRRTIVKKVFVLQQPKKKRMKRKPLTAQQFIDRSRERQSAQEIISSLDQKKVPRPKRVLRFRKERRTVAFKRKLMKVTSLSDQERKDLDAFKRSSSKRKKNLKKVGSKIDFRRLLG